MAYISNEVENNKDYYRGSKIKSGYQYYSSKSILLTIANNGESLGHLLLLKQGKAKFGLY